ncbi:MAG: hypothetical protein ACHP6I_01080 [Rickettsiales bacterium]
MHYSLINKLAEAKSHKEFKKFISEYSGDTVTIGDMWTEFILGINYDGAIEKAMEYHESIVLQQLVEAAGSTLSYKSANTVFSYANIHNSPAILETIFQNSIDQLYSVNDRCDLNFADAAALNQLTKMIVYLENTADKLSAEVVVRILLTAAKENNAEVVDVILNNAGTRISNDNIVEVFSIALSNNQPDIMQMAGNAAGENFYLDYLCDTFKTAALNGNIEVIQTIWDFAGSRLDSSTISTAFAWAASTGNTDIMQSLYDNANDGALDYLADALSLAAINGQNRAIYKLNEIANGRFSSNDVLRALKHAIDKDSSYTIETLSTIATDDISNEVYAYALGHCQKGALNTEIIYADIAVEHGMLASFNAIRNCQKIDTLVKDLFVTNQDLASDETLLLTPGEIV